MIVNGFRLCAVHTLMNESLGTGTFALLRTLVPRVRKFPVVVVMAGVVSTFTRADEAMLIAWTNAIYVPAKNVTVEFTAVCEEKNPLT